MQLLARAACLVVITATTSCGGAQDGARTAPSASPKPVAAPTRAAPGHLARGEVERVLAQGPPWILRRVLTEAVLRDGKFSGWRIVALPEEWRGVDLKPGDVVTKVNGVVVEKPDDLWNVWTGLSTADALRVQYERDGTARELTLPIDGAPGKQASARPADAPPPPRAPGKPRGTIVIEDDDSLGSPPAE